MGLISATNPAAKRNEASLSLPAHPSDFPLSFKSRVPRGRTLSRLGTIFKRQHLLLDRVSIMIQVETRHRRMGLMLCSDSENPRGGWGSRAKRSACSVTPRGASCRMWIAVFLFGKASVMSDLAWWHEGIDRFTDPRRQTPINPSSVIDGLPGRWMDPRSSVLRFGATVR